MPECHTKIDRGLAYKCEEYEGYDSFEHREVEEEGCGLFFCLDHIDHTDHEEHSVRKPDSLEWEAHMLTDESWGPWRDEHPEAVSAMKARQ